MLGEYPSVHLHRSEVGQDHQLALAGEIARQNSTPRLCFQSLQ